VFAAGVAAQVGAEVALRTAIEKETVKGDLKGAIDQYKKLAQDKDRAVAAKAGSGANAGELRMMNR
jgi:hypothetical protein